MRLLEPPTSAGRPWESLDAQMAMAGALGICSHRFSCEVHLRHLGVVLRPGDHRFAEGEPWTTSIAPVVLRPLTSAIMNHHSLTKSFDRSSFLIINHYYVMMFLSGLLDLLMYSFCTPWLVDGTSLSSNPSSRRDVTTDEFVNHSSIGDQSSKDSISDHSWFRFRKIQEMHVIKKLREALTYSRVEKALAGILLRLVAPFLHRSSFITSSLCCLCIDVIGLGLSGCRVTRHCC